VNWTEGRNLCRLLDSEMTSITSNEENEFLKAMRESKHMYWPLVQWIVNRTLIYVLVWYNVWFLFTVFLDLWVDPAVSWWIGLVDDRGEALYTFVDGNVMPFNNFYFLPNNPNYLCIYEYIRPLYGPTYMWKQYQCDSDSKKHLICKRPSGYVNILLTCRNA